MLNLKSVLPPIRNLEPSEDCILWRYTDIPSLLEILSFNYLPLIKVSSLSDPAEGAMLKFALNKLRLPKPTTDFGRNLVFDMYQKSTFVSSWCANNDELAPMWERFARKDGVAIKTTAKRLMEYLVPGHGFNIKSVEYIKKSQDDILSQLDFLDLAEFLELLPDLYFYKMSDFRDEREIRIFKCQVPWNAYGLIATEEIYGPGIEKVISTEILPSKYIMEANVTSMSDFILEIVISPTARPGIFKVINNLLQRIGRPELCSKIREYRRNMWF